MNTKNTSLETLSLFPFLTQNDDDNDEVVLFEEEVGDGDTDDQQSFPFTTFVSGGGFGGSFNVTGKEPDGEVVFVRSSKDPVTGDFYGEPKTMQWCIDNGFEEVKPGVWSGEWFFTYLFGEEEGRRAWVESTNKRLVKESGGKAMRASVSQLRAMLTEKQKGNRAFNRGQYKRALDSYLKAEQHMGGAVSGMFLIPQHRDELVKVLSNQAECYLRMKKYDKAIVQATTALSLDRNHTKSMLRRARATYQKALRTSAANTTRSSNGLNSIVVARAAEDLQRVINMKSTASTSEAQALLDEMERSINGLSTKSQ